jgi:small GTP-binding protein
MALFNYTAKEITLKVVYYGPGFSGKTTNLQYLHSILPARTRGKLISLTTEADRTLFFDFLPIDMGKIKDFNIRFQLYTVPGQVRYNATRRLVLRGADAVVFVADSQKEMKEQNLESLNNMRDNLTVNNLDPDNIPVIFQYNKRDLKNILSIEELNSELNKNNAIFFEAVAVEGKGVENTFRESTNILSKHITEKYKLDMGAPAEEGVPPSEIFFPKHGPSETILPITPLPSAETPAVAEPPLKQTIVEKTIIQQPQINLDLSGIVSAVSELKDVMSEINNSLKEMQKKQAKMVNELSEIRQIFLEAKGNRTFRKLFG